MNFLLRLTRLIDALNERVGRSVLWLVLVAVLVSAINAIVRKAFNLSSNAFLELQWYLFSAIFMLGAGYTLLQGEHVRIDVIVGRLSPRRQAMVELIGTTLFLLPVSLLLMYLSWPMFVDSLINAEQSSNAGGLPRWWVKVLLPAGFGLLALQGISELIKRIAFLTGHIDDPAQGQHSKRGGEQLAEEIAGQHGSAAEDLVDRHA